ncbi:MAG: Fic family protein [Bacteroidales bacterium]|nr:Fic family protein [Bacteroidales bacterium]
MARTTIQEALSAWENIHPLTQKQIDRLRLKFTVEFNYNSNHIEGNTLTYGQTEILLLFGKVSGTADMRDFEEMKASNVGLKMMTEEAKLKDVPLTQNFIRTLHKTLLREDYTVYRNLPGGMQTSFVIPAGQYKTRPNSVITRYGDRFEYASPEETPALMSDLICWYNEEEQKGELTAFQLAALFHYRYIRIHPFEDGNGRIARLMVNYILARHGYPMIVVRSRKKSDYLEALHKADLLVGAAPSDGARATINDIEPFARYFIQLIADEIMADVRFVSEPDDNVWWYDGERVQFRTPNYNKILRELRVNPSASYSDLQQLTGINRSALQKLIQQCSEKKYIIPNPEGAGWHVVITPSR